MVVFYSAGDLRLAWLRGLLAPSPETQCPETEAQARVGSLVYRAMLLEYLEVSSVWILRKKKIELELRRQAGGTCRLGNKPGPA
jgi:hypothetical protein